MGCECLQTHAIFILVHLSHPMSSFSSLKTQVESVGRIDESGEDLKEYKINCQDPFFFSQVSYFGF